ncbi:MAG: hypothetical protein FJ189_10075 [Gammaproteobacteria bacterium]|nr:hypothetical protein [Gammaproteobacteria bacterium]
MTTRRFVTHAVIVVVIVVAMTAIAIWLNLGPMVHAQSRVQIEPWDGDARVHLAPLDDAGAARFAYHFQSANGQAMRPFALSLTNETEATIAAVTLRWTIATPSGSGVIVHRIQSEAFGGLRGVITRTPIDAGGGKLLSESATGMRLGIPPGESVMLTPGSYYDSRGGGGGWYNELIDARAPRVRIDAVIFEDGLVLGPDELGTVDTILARKAALDEVLGVIADAERTGQNPTTAIRALAQPQPGEPLDRDGMTIRSLAMELLRAPDMAKTIDGWRKIRLPAFYR